MSKFKVGDKVKSLETAYKGCNGWPIGVVSGVDGNLVYVDLGDDSGLAHFEKEVVLYDEVSLSGGLNSYYLVEVSRPQRDDQTPYIAECEDIIGALDLNFDEGNIFKAIWRAANARKGNGKAGHVPKYDAEKVYHSAGRILKRNS